jgi:hypothetical protein
MGFFKNEGSKEKDASKPVKRISTPAGQRLSVILENKDSTNSGTLVNKGSSEGSSNRWQSDSTFAPSSRSADRKRFALPSSLDGRLSSSSKNGFYGLDSIPSNDTGSKPYDFAPSIWSEAPAADSLPTTFTDKVGEGIRRRREAWSARRGGWGRILLILLCLLVLLAIGLGAGLGVGLKHSASTSSAENGGDGGDENENGPGHEGGGTSNLPPSGQFPAGKWAVSTFLDTVQTNCTSDSATWSCFPYVTYYENQSRSRAIFNWIISQDPASSDEDPSYFIHSSSNPFSISFPQTRLKVYDKGSDDERYTFQFTTQKRVYPKVPLTHDNAATVCLYSTNFQATLYAKQDNHVTMVNHARRSRRDFTPWPYMASIEQTATSGDAALGDAMPQCYRSENGKPTGDELDIRPAAAGGVCSCYYRDWLTPSR